MKQIGMRLGALSLSALLCLVALEWFLSGTTVRPSYGYPFGMNFRINLDREVLYKVVPHSSPEINGQGYRDDEFSFDKRDRKRILFLGDSFVMGLTGTPEQTIPGELERQLGPDYEVFNMGIYGYGPDQSLIQLIDEGLAFDPDVVILALFPSNDFNDLYKNRLFELDASGTLRRTPTNAVTATLPAMESLYWADHLLYAMNISGRYFEDLFITLHKDTTDLDLYGEGNADRLLLKERLMAAVLGAFREELGARGIDFLTIIIPGGPELAARIVVEFGGDPYGAEQVAAEIVRAERIPLIDYTEMLTGSRHYRSLYALDPGGEHLGPFGHRTVASHIEPYLSRIDAESTPPRDEPSQTVSLTETSP